MHAGFGSLNEEDSCCEKFEGVSHRRVLMFVGERIKSGSEIERQCCDLLGPL